MSATISAFYWSWLITGIFSLCQGLFVYIKNPASRLNLLWLCFNICIFFCGTGFYLSGVASSTQMALWSIRLLNIGAVFIPVLYMHFTYVLAGLDREKLTDLRLAYIATFLLLPFVFTNLYIHSIGPKMGFKYWLDPGPVYFLFIVMFLVIVSHFHVVVFKRRSQMKNLVRNQVNHVLTASAIGFTGGLTTFPMAFNIECFPFGIVLIALVPFIISFAIIKHHLMDITVIIRKTLIYSVVTGTLTGLYLVIVSIFAHVFEGWAGYQTVFSPAVAAGLITLGFQPLRKRVQGFVDSKFFRQYVDREEKLYELSREVITHTTQEAMAESLVRVLSDTLHPKIAALYLKSQTSGSFLLASKQDNSVLPQIMPESNSLADYFADHPQPFVQQDIPSGSGEPLDTRRPSRKEDAA
jgi:hypothetical protein